MNDVGVTKIPAILTTIAAHIVDFEPDRVSLTALDVAKVGVTDTIGVALAGLPEPCTQILMATPGVANAPGPCVIFGTDRRTSALDAALVNGVASHALDYDDFSSVFGGHQSAPLVAPLFALAVEQGRSGQDILTDYVAGFEVEHRFARALHPHHYDKGWHPTATLGIFGVAAAAGRALGLDASQMACALAIAASTASGLKANFGTMTKPLHVGYTARGGLLAAYLARGGFDANPAAMEHHQGFFNVFNGPGTFDPAPLQRNWDGPLEIEAPTLSLKQFPCCGSTHQVIFAMLNLAREEAIDADQVAAIDIKSHPQRFRHTNTPHPTSVLQAKFSVQYTVARALLDGAVALKDFENDAFLQPEIGRLLDVTTAEAFPEDGPDGPWDAMVGVTLKDGRHLSRRVENMVGRSGDNAMSVDELQEKFMDCAVRALPTDQAGAAFADLMTLEAQTDMEKVTSLLAIPAG